MNINFSALSRDITDQEMQTYKQSINYGLKQFVIKSITVWAMMIFLGLFSLIMLPMIIVAANGRAWLGSMILLTILTIDVLGALFLARLTVKKSLERAWHLQAFVDQNNLGYSAGVSNPAHKGLIFNIGDTRFSHDVIYSKSGELFEIGNYQYSTGSGRDRSTSFWGYVCIELDRNVPNMVLDAKGNDAHLLGLHMSDLPVSYTKDQRLSLEGDFDKYFTLYAPVEYKTDALYIFTPDLMALLVDDVAQFDVEIVDNRMYVYSTTRFDMLNVKMMERLFTIIQTVGVKIDSRTDTYADDRVGDRAANIVAPQGVRLKRGVPMALIVFFVIMVIVQLAPHILTLLFRLHN